LSIDNKLIDWCRVPPPAPKNDYKKLLASGILCVILSASIFAGLPIYSVLFAGSAGSLVASGTILSIASVGQGPLYLQNATYQQLAEANNATIQNYDLTMESIGANGSNVLYFGAIDFNGAETSAALNLTIINLGDKDLTATSIDIYRGNSIFAQINGPFLIKAHSVGSLILQMYNLTSLSEEEAQFITQFRHEGKSDATIFAGRVMYPMILKTSENITASYEMIVFPTAYVWPDCA
jgi:hypothetical protein